jgi:aminoglycoside 6'-N-acetyltransferase
MTFDSLHFESLAPDYFPWLFKWLHAPHVKQWYAEDASLSNERLQAKYLAILEGRKKVQAFMICDGKNPIGYIQMYALADFPIKGIKLNSAQAAGIDFYIGDANYIGKGYGAASLQRFLDQWVFPSYSECFVDPQTNNNKALRCYQACGFKIYQNSEQKEQIFTLLRKDRPIQAFANYPLIRWGKETDALALASLIQQLEYSLSLEEVSKHIKLYTHDHSYALFVAESNSQVLGCAALHLLIPFHASSPTCRVVSLVVDQKARRQKIASQLLARAESYARNKNCPTLELTTDQRRKALGAHQFYFSVGYTTEHTKLYFRKEKF